MAKVKVGIIGAGNIAQYHLEGYRQLEDAEIYAVCDVDPQRAKETATRFGASHWFTDYQDLLRLPELQAVSVCTIDSLYAQVSIDALRAGKHVLCEKPVGLDADTVMKMKDESEKTGKLLMAGFVRRFGEDVRAAHELIDKGTLGKLFYVKSSYLRRDGAPGGWFLNRRLSGGGPAIDLGIHYIDMARYLLGTPKAVSVRAAAFSMSADSLSLSAGCDEIKEPAPSDVEDAACAFIYFENGAVLSLDTSYKLHLQKDVNVMECFGTKGGLRLSDKAELFSTVKGCAEDKVVSTYGSEDLQQMFCNETAHFLDCVSHGTSCISNMEDAVEAARIIDALYESAKQNREITLKCEE